MHSMPDAVRAVRRPRLAGRSRRLLREDAMPVRVPQEGDAVKLSAEMHRLRRLVRAALALRRAEVAAGGADRYFRALDAFRRAADAVLAAPKAPR